MDFNKLFQLQRNLDQRINAEKSLENESLFSKKILALQVEVSELANETRCFKFWSNKGPSDKHTILEEYVDCLHFILSLGLEKNYENLDLIIRDEHHDLTEAFLNMYIDINDFLVCTTKDNYKTLFEDFLSLGRNLGLTSQDI